MVNITLSVPEDMKQEMDEFKEMNWSEVARASIRKRLILLREFKEFTKNSELSEEDVECAPKSGQIVKQVKT